MSDHRALLENALRTIQDQRARLEKVERASNEPIAIIGMGCRFPGGADTPTKFWDLLRNGVDTAGDIPNMRWDINAYYDPDPDAAGKIYVRAGSFLEKPDQFDPGFFAISPREAPSIDPQQRLLLEVAWEALEHAGIAADQLRASRTGVFVGAFLDDYAALRMYAAAPDQIEPYRFLSSLRGVIAGRLSFALNLQGPTMQVDTACSSSLLATHLACQALRSQECNLALAGGVFLILAPQSIVGLCRMRAIAPDGRSKTFDARADGFGIGEGCGLVVLKRCSDALRDGDNILALIRGSAVNHDGASNGITAPNGLAQEAVLRQALQNAQVTGAQIQYVETHGTGTPLGDPIEVMALANVLGENRTMPLALGSVKTNIGHTSAAAGVAALMKTVLAIQHKEIPPTLHLTQLNPHIPWDSVPIVVPTQLTPWDAPTRLAGVSAFGMTGTNVHVIVEEAGPVIASREAASPRERGAQSPSSKMDAQRAASPQSTLLAMTATVERPYHLLCLSAKSTGQEDSTALRDLAQRYERYLVSPSQEALADICFTANTGRAHFPNRLALIAESREQLQAQLAAFANGETSDKLVAGTRSVSRNRPKIAFLFTGQGSQYVGMGRALYETQPAFRAIMDRCDVVMQASLGRSLIELIYPATKPEHNDLIESHQCAQAVSFAIACALADLWRSWGVQPDFVLGHSMGDFAAAYAAGVLSLEDGMRLWTEPVWLMEQELGSMVAVLGSEAEVQPFIAPFADVAIGVINAPRSIVISGGHANVARVVEQLQQAGFKTRRLDIPIAAHSPLVEPVLDAYEAALRKIKFTPPTCSVVSSRTGKLVSSELIDPVYWRKHLCSTVRFADGVKTLQEQGATIFVEIGPKPTLLGAVEQCLDIAEHPFDSAQGSPVGTDNGSPYLFLPSLRANRSDWEQILESLGALYVQGVDIDWCGLDRDYSRQKVALPANQNIGDISAETKAAETTVTFRQNLQAAQPSEHEALLTAHIQETVANILGKTNSPSARVGFFESGMDSLMALELRRRLERSLQIGLPATVAFEYPTSERLAEYLLAEALPELAGSKSNSVIPSTEFTLRNEGLRADLRNEGPAQNRTNELAALPNLEAGSTSALKGTPSTALRAGLEQELNKLETLLKGLS